MDDASTRITYSENGNSLTQQWEVGDCLIGYCGDKRFAYKVKAVSDGTAYLTYDSGDRLSGTESNIYMYYAPGCSYTDITSGTLALDITQQTVESALKAPMAASGSFSNGSLTLSFSNKGAILRLDRLCWLPANSTVTAVKVYSANSSGTFSGTNLNNCASSTITLTKEGGWSTDAFGEMTDTVRIPILPQYGANIRIKAIVGDTEYPVFNTTINYVIAGRYYYPAPYLVRMVSGGNTTYYTDFSAALTAANASAADVNLTLLSDCGTDGSERTFNNTNAKISLDFDDYELKGKNVIKSEVAFSASGTGSASNASGNVVLVNAGGNFTMTGSSLTSESVDGNQNASPLAVVGTSETVRAYASVTGTTITGKTTYGAAFVKYGNLTINDGSTLKSKRSLVVSLDGVLTINGGTFTGTSSQMIHIAGATSVSTIHGGTFSASGNLVNFYSATSAAGALNIDGGKFSWGGNFNGDNAGTRVSVTGGLYSKVLPSSGVVASGYSCVSNPDPETSTSYPYLVKQND